MTNIIKVATAQKIAAQFDDDGTVWADEDGISIEAACDEHASPVTAGGCQLYVFDDNSQIVITPQGWTDTPQDEDLAVFAMVLLTVKIWWDGQQGVPVTDHGWCYTVSDEHDLVDSGDIDWLTRGDVAEVRAYATKQWAGASIEISE